MADDESPIYLKCCSTCQLTFDGERCCGDCTSGGVLSATSEGAGLSGAGVVNGQNAAAVVTNIG